MNRPSPIPASLFSVVLGLAGLGQAWRVAVRLWNAPPAVGEIVLLCATLVWLGLLIGYLMHAIQQPARTVDEFRHPVAGGTPALLGISTLLICQALLPYSLALAWVLAIAGISWQLLYSVWHTGTLWQGGRQPTDSTPALYLPTVAGNLTGASALGALGYPEWAWLLFGAGVFSWLALEPLVIRRLWHGEPLAVAQRSSIGIQFAPPVVCAAALLVIAPDTPAFGLLMLLGYSFYQMLIGLRLKSWLGTQPFGYSWWAFSFGVVSATVTCVKLAANGVPAAATLAMPVFVGANVFIGYLCVRSLRLVWRAQVQ
ncbi:MAG: dicarboxylate transporter/tellurite-resistance protein TehA [Pseudomonas sp.]|nr:dicarboxylate transporter/tellurite-resistance protein TehA [Pseudomonas sp.]